MTNYRVKYRWHCATCPAHGVSLSEGNSHRLLTKHWRTYHAPQPRELWP